MKSYISIKDSGIFKHVMEANNRIIGESRYTTDNLLTVLKPARITLLLETNRLQSLYLCELLQSYSIQSQRYCRYDLDIDKNTIFENSELFSDLEMKNINNIMEKSLRLYLKMTQLKEGSENKVKFTTDDFKYKIPIDDGRYILPMSFKCNCEMTIDGHVLLELLTLLYNNTGIFGKMYDELIRELETITNIDNIINYITKPYIAGMIIAGERTVSTQFMNNFFAPRHFCPDTFVRMLDSINSCDAMNKSGAAALICTTTDKSVEEIFDSKTIDTFAKITERVACGTKHTSIAEHASFNFIMTCSVPCYNQFIRHRHQQAIREDFDLDFICNEYLPFVYPDSIMNSKFSTEIQIMVNEIRDLIIQLIESTFETCSNYSDMNRVIRINAIKQLIPMGYEMRILWSTNLVNEMYKSTKRTCMKAHWEIRNITHEILSILKYKIKSDSVIFDSAKPGCCNGQGCPEGKFTCGDNSQVKCLFEIE